MSLAGRIVVLQGAIGLLCLVVFLIVDVAQGRAAFFALATSLVPSALYAWIQQRTLNATRVLLYGVYKAIATMTLMVVCFVALKVAPLGFFVSFAAMQLAYVAGLTMRDSK